MSKDAIIKTSKALLDDLKSIAKYVLLMVASIVPLLGIAYGLMQGSSKVFELLGWDSSLGFVTGFFLFWVLFALGARSFYHYQRIKHGVHYRIM